MYTLMAFVIGGLTAAGVYMMLRLSLIKLAIGLVLLSQAANLLIFTVGGLVRASPPIVQEQPVASVQEQPVAVLATADPLPQALILTAIVIGFAVLAFLLVLIYRVYETTQSDNLDEIRAPEV